MIQKSLSTINIDRALFQVQGMISGVTRDATNPFHKSKYATLEAVINTAREPLQKAGIVLMQSPGGFRDGCQEIETRLVHIPSGEWIRSTLWIPVKESTPQGCGSAITYGCRYSLMPLLAMPPTDDDGEVAMGRMNIKANPAGKTAHQARKDDKYPGLEAGMRAQKTKQALIRWGTEYSEDIHDQPDSWQRHLQDEYKELLRTLPDE